MRTMGVGRGGTVDQLHIVAGPRRLRILELVWHEELAAGDIAAQFDVSWSAISQHLAVLKKHVSWSNAGWGRAAGIKQTRRRSVRCAR